MTDQEKDKNNENNAGINLFSRGNLTLIAVLIAAVVLVVPLTHISYNRTLQQDAAIDIVGETEDIADEIIELLEDSQAAAVDIAADLPEDASALSEAFTEALDEDIIASISRAGIYRSEGETLVLQMVGSADDITTETLDGDAVSEVFDPAWIADDGEAAWLYSGEGIHLTVPLENGDGALWMDVSSDNLHDILAAAAARESLLSETQAGYVLLTTGEGEVIATYNEPQASTEQVNSVLGNLTAENRPEEEEYYEVEQDAINEQASYLSQVELDVQNWHVIGSIPVAESPSVTIVESTLNLFEFSDIGTTFSVIVEDVVSYLNQNLSWLFRGLRWPIEQVISTFENILKTTPWIIVIGVTTVIAYFTAGRRTAYIAAFGMYIIGLIGLWDRTMTTMAMLLTSMAFCIVVGIPLGIWAARNDRVNEIVRSVLDAMQTIHPFVYLVPIVVLFGIGKVPGTIATIIFALPPMVRLTNLGIRQVPEDVIEASKAFGSSDWQLLRDVQIPLALPSIMAGVNQTLMLSLSMVVIVALIAGQGLGEEIYRAIGRADTGRAVVAGVAVLLLAVVVDRVSQGRTGIRTYSDEG